MTTKPFEFEKALHELEEITAWFESSQVDLDQGLTKFERGMELASQLKDHLQLVENKVEKIRQRFSEPKPSLEQSARTNPVAVSHNEQLPSGDDEPGPEATDDQAGLF
ncbi:MAG TPA: exodeoxyribonuclease VII small subunit [Candidatus Saccharimonadia bacterium]|nr:exodeoxyribonuclease VII small subunit [Candidatus Saccharimonadia bacterium]